MLVVVAGLRFSRVHAARGVDELLDRDVAIPALPVEVPALRRGVFHAADVENAARGSAHPSSAVEAAHGSRNSDVAEGMDVDEQMHAIREGLAVREMAHVRILISPQ